MPPSRGAEDYGARSEPSSNGPSLADAVAIAHDLLRTAAGLAYCRADLIGKNKSEVSLSVGATGQGYP